MTNQLKTVLLMGTLTALVAAFGALVAPGQPYPIAALALAMNLGVYLFWDRVVLRRHPARAPDVADARKLHASADERARRAELPKPRVHLSRSVPARPPSA